MKNRLRELREMRNLSQAELAEALDVSTSTIGMIEQGRRNPSHELMDAICDFFNVSVDYFMRRSDTSTYITLHGPREMTPRRKFLLDKLEHASEEQIDKLAQIFAIMQQGDDDDDSADD